MLDENLPTYRFKPSSDNAFHTLLYFTQNGSDPSAEYLIKRPLPSTAKNQYALGLLDAQYSSVIYAEVLLEPEWSQPTLSAAEVRAAGTNPAPIAVTPDTFTISLYNPDQSIVVKQHHGSWGKSHAWEFEIPERTFKLPSASQIDQDSSEVPVSELVPKVVLRWKRDGRLSRDMTCYMCGRSVGGKKSKEPDITIALFQGKNEAAMTLYEPNMRRVEVEDRKGLEMVLLMSAEVIRDLYLSPRQDPFHTAGGAAPASSSRRRTNSRPSVSPPGAAMSGALGNARPSSPRRQQSPTQPSDAQRQAEVEAETRRLQAMVAEEDRQARERAKRDQEEQKRIQKMLEKEEKERRKREAEIEKETERLRREYGVDGQDFTPSASSPPLPPRSNLAVPGGWGTPTLPPRPNSVGPASPPQPQFAAPPQQPIAGGGKKPRFANFLGGGSGSGSGPYGGPATASVSGFFGRGEEGKKKVQKKRSVHF
ncbi:Fc.00g005560.m01.CDS01 [Cosmosporella sp. VM-42]